MKARHSFNFRSAGIDYSSQDRSISNNEGNDKNDRNDKNVNNDKNKNLSSYIQMNKNMKTKKSKYQKE